MKVHVAHSAFLTYIAKYLGVALIAGSVVHIGTLHNGITRYVVLIVIGFILTIFGNINEAKELGQKINLRYLMIIIGLSFATGFLSGGVQHYLDNPSYAGVLLGIGIVIEYITFFLKDNYILQKKNVIILVLLAITFMAFSHYVMDDALLGYSHHEQDEVISH